MDEMRMVRRLLAEPPPSPWIAAEGRARLFGSPSREARKTRTTSTTRRVALRSAVGLGLTGAAAATALVVATLVPGAGTSPGGRGPATTDGSARTVLLAAAERAESAPTDGTYWHVRSRSKTTLQRMFGRGDNRYALELLSVTEVWTKRSGQTWWGRREWVRPKTREDEAAWQRDGSPSKWCMGNTDTEPPEPNCLHTEPGEASLTRVDDETFVFVEGRELTFEQLQRLPEDPDALRAWVVEAVEDDLDKNVSAEIVDHNVAEVLANLLVDVPVPPGVRAGAFRALAEMPNVTNNGPTRDELGRAGVAIEIATGGVTHIVEPGASVETGELTRTLIIDQDTSHVLASETNVGEDSVPVNRALILEVGWTDEEPHEPEQP